MFQNVGLSCSMSTSFETEIARNSNSLLVIQVIQNDKTGQDLKPFANLTH